MAQNKRKAEGNAPCAPPCYQEMESYAKQAPERLRAIADDPETPVKTKIEIEKWFFESVFGKCLQNVERERPPVEIQALDLSKLTDEELLRMAAESDG